MAGQRMCWHGSRVYRLYGASNCVASNLLNEEIRVDIWEFCAYAGGGRQRVAYRGLSTGYFKPAREKEHI
jgi:hypothetical protein